MASLNDLKDELSSVTKSLSEIQRKVHSLLQKQEKFQERKQELELEIKCRERVYANCQNVEAGGENSWSSAEFKWSKNLSTILKERFGITKLREMQLETMNATLSKRDVILIMPTGGGKSLCYQAPAMISGLTLVISPLISLIEDQIVALQSLGINAKKLSASSSREEVNATHKDMVAKDLTLKLLYVTPEKIAKSKRFMAQLEKCYKAGNLSRIAIDEVHCASQWGNDFRPDYKILGILKRQFPETPLLGLTATSTDKVTLDTKKILNVPFAMVFKTALNRPNLFYEVCIKPDSYDGTIEDICLTIKSSFPNSSGIIYCFSCKNCEEVSKSLCKRGILSAAYHGRMESDDRQRVHMLWLKDKVKVICATVAFGMGIDKPDVRYVIHFSMSKSIENYYQESGRAGRDGQPALCLLYYGFADIFKQSTMVFTEHTGLYNLNKVLEYCQNTSTCRRAILFSHFGDEWTSDSCRNGCDICNDNPDKGDSREDITGLCSELVTIAKKALKAGERLTGTKLVDAASGRGKFKTLNSDLKQLSGENMRRIIVFMLLNEYLKEDFHFTPYSTISYLIPGAHVALLSSRTCRLHLPKSRKKRKQTELYENFCKCWCSQDLTINAKERKRPPDQVDDDSPSCSKKCKLKGEREENRFHDGKVDLTVNGPSGRTESIVISDSDDDFT